jgi:hypothetical protein
VPDPAAQKEAERVIRDIFKEDYNKRTGPDKKALAKTLLDQALESKNDPASQFVLLREARDLASQAGDIETSFKSIDEIGKRFAVESMAMKLEVLASTRTSVKSLEEYTGLAKAYLKLSEDAFRSDDYEVASKSVEAAISLAKKGKDLPLLTKAEGRGKEIAEQRSRLEKVKKARESLSKNPDDPAANLAVGQEECFIKGNWDIGLPLLGKSGDSTLRGLAAKDMAAPLEAGDQVVVADGWWDLADKEAGITRDHLRTRALYWYQKAGPNLTGLQKTKADKRQAQIRLEILAKGNWVDVMDPGLFGLVGKPGDPIELGLNTKVGIVALMKKFPPGDFDAISFRVRIKPNTSTLGLLAYVPDAYAAWISTKVGRFEAASLHGGRWTSDIGTKCPITEEYLCTIVVSESEHIFYLNGQESFRRKAPNSLISGVKLVVEKEPVTFDQIKLRRKE